MFRERLMQGASAFDSAFYVEHKFLHRRLLMTIADDFEGLHHRNSRRHHGCELPREHGDVYRQNLSAGSKRRTWRLDASGRYALASQIGPQRCFVGSKRLAAHLVAAFVL